MIRCRAANGSLIAGQLRGCGTIAAMIPADLEALTQTLQRRQLTTPVLLLLASHHPLAFVTGQLLYALAPLGLLLGWESVNDWATLLSGPEATKQLTALLSTPSAARSTHIQPPAH